MSSQCGACILLLHDAHMLEPPPHHSILCQLADIGQDELVLQNFLHSTFTQSTAWDAIGRGVLAHLNNATPYTVMHGISQHIME